MSDDPVVHVIDDDEAMRDSLTFLLGSARLAVRTYESATDFLARLNEATTGCIITDIRMPEVSGVDLMRRLRHMDIALPVIVITGHADVSLAVEAMKLGALEFLEKPFDDDLLLEAVRAALDRSERQTKRDVECTGIRERLQGLSGRERDVLRGLIAGQPNKTIAYDLGISPRTVEIYRSNVMTKMQAPSLSHLVRMALVVGALDDDGVP